MRCDEYRVWKRKTEFYGRMDRRHSLRPIGDMPLRRDGTSRGHRPGRDGQTPTRKDRATHPVYDPNG